jgi:hypothetical protein
VPKDAISPRSVAMMRCSSLTVFMLLLSGI